MSAFGYQSLLGLSSIDTDIVDTNTLIVEKDLTVNGNSTLQSLTLPSGASLGKILTCSDSLGDSYWSSPAIPNLSGDATGPANATIVNTLGNGTISVNSLVSMTGSQTLTNKNITGLTNTVSANSIRYSSVYYVSFAGIAPVSGNVLTYNGANAVWSAPATQNLTGDVTSVGLVTTLQPLSGDITSVGRVTTAGPNIVSLTGTQTLTNKTLGYTICSKNINMNNQIQNKMIALYDGGTLTDQTQHNYIGLGNSASTFRFQCIDTSTDFAFFNATSSTASNNTFRIKGNGNVGIGNGSSQGIGAANPMNTLDVDGNSSFGVTGNRSARIGDSTAIINAFALQSGSGNFLRMVRENVGKIDINCSTGSYVGISKHIDFVDTDNGSVVPLSVAIDGSKRIVCGGNITMINGRLDITTGSTGNIGIGTNSLAGNTSGTQNTALGYNALTATTTAYLNTAVGSNSQQLATGNINTSVGVNALQNAAGSYNVAMGYGASRFNTTGGGNTAIGTGSLISGTTSNNNTCVGQNSGGSIVSGSDSITCIGNLADVSADTWTNSTALGNGAIVTASNTIQLGNSATTNVNTSGTINCGGAINPLYVNTPGIVAGGILNATNNYQTPGNGQGAYIGWNRSGGGAETNFVNNTPFGSGGNGSGGWQFATRTTDGVYGVKATIDGSNGNLSLSGSLTYTNPITQYTPTTLVGSSTWPTSGLTCGYSITGRMVYISYTISWAIAPGAGTISISLPFNTVNSGAMIVSCFTVGYYNGINVQSTLCANANSNSNKIILSSTSTTGGGNGSVLGSYIFANGQIQLSGWYYY